MRNRAIRRELRKNAIKRRSEILQNGNFQGGLLYEKHRYKIEEKGLGYMSKHGNLLHYAQGTNPVSQKVRDRSSYNGTTNWSPKDVKQMDSMNEQEYEYENEE